MIDLSPWLAAVPDAVVERLRAARRVLAVGHENPDADTLGASARGRPARRARAAARPTPVFADPVPPLYDFLPGIDRARTDPDPAPTTTCSSSRDCGSLDRIGAVARAPRGAVRAPAAGRRSTTTPRTTRPATADWIDPAAAATCEMVDAPRGPARRAARRRRRRARGAADGRRSSWTRRRSPTRTRRRGRWPSSAALVEAGAPLSDISRRLYRSKPDAQLRLFGRVLDRLETAADGRVVHSTLLDADLAATGADRGPLRGDHRPARPVRGGRGRDPVQGGRPTATRISVRTKPGGVDATVLTGRVRRRRPRPRGRRDDRGARRRGPAARSSPRPSGSPPRSPLTGARVARARAGRHPRRRQAGRPDVARRRRRSSAGWRRRSGSATAGRSTRSRAASCRCSSAARRGSSSTTSATARRYRATVCFGASSTTDDLEGELTPGDGPGAGPRRPSRRPWRPSAARSRSGRPPTARSRSPAGGRTRWPGPARPSSSPPREVTIDAPRARRLGRRATRTGRSPSSTSRCSAGTYVRALARDLGEAVGSAAYLGALVRTASGPFTLDGAIAARRHPGGGRGRRRTGSRALLLPIDAGLDALPAVVLDRRRGRRDRRAASSSGRPRGLPRPPATARSASATTPARSSRSRPLRDGRLAPDKVLVDAPARRRPPGA